MILRLFKYLLIILGLHFTWVVNWALSLSELQYLYLHNYIQNILAFTLFFISFPCLPVFDFETLILSARQKLLLQIRIESSVLLSFIRHTSAIFSFQLEIKKIKKKILVFMQQMFHSISLSFAPLSIHRQLIL